MPRESSLSRWLLRARRPGLVLLRVESPSTPGLPDVYAAEGGRSAWIELKTADAPASPRALVRPRFEAFQLPRQELLRRAGVPVLVLIQAGKRRYLVEGGSAYIDRRLRDIEEDTLVSPDTPHPYDVISAALRFRTT